MYDYTPEGIRHNQLNLTVAYLNLIDKKLAKISRRLTTLTLLGIAVFVIKHKNDIKELKNMRGE